MNSILKFTIFTVFFGFSIISGINAQTVSSKSSELEFPTIEGWNRGEIVRLPDKRLGYGINYDSPEAGRVTIYVYDLGRTDIPDGVENKIIKDEIERAKGEILTVAQMGYYQNVKELKNDTVTLGGQDGKLKSLHTVFNFSMNNQPLVSEIYLFGYKNNFFKMRVTYPRVEGETENKALTDFLMQIENLLSK